MLTAPEVVVGGASRCGDYTPIWRLARFWSRDRVSKAGRNAGLRLCRAVLRVDTVPAQKITQPLDFIAQGWKGCPLLQAGGLTC